MKIGVLTDSSAYLTAEQCQKYQIKVMPIPLIWGEKTYRDMVDISVSEFYQKLKTSTVLPTTSQPSAGELKAYIDDYVENGYTDVFVISISSGLSSFYNALSSYAKTETRLHVHAFDSKITCAGLGQMVILAARLVQEGAKPQEIEANLENLRQTTDVRFMVDNLQYLRRTGRLSNASSFVGGLLKIKPILGMDVQEKGEISAIAKERQNKRAYDHIKRDFSRLIRDKSYPIQVTIFDAMNPQAKKEWHDDFAKSFPNVKILESIIGPVVGVHVGQGTMAIIWSRDLDDYFKS